MNAHLEKATSAAETQATFGWLHEDKPLRVIVQGLTGAYGRLQTQEMLNYGTNVVAGVAPGKGGQIVNGISVFDLVNHAVAETQANASIIYVGPSGARAATLEAIHAGLKTIVIATEFVPLRDTLEIRDAARQCGAWLVGPNTVGMIAPPLRTLLGTLAPEYAISGSVSIVSRSGSLAVEAARQLADKGIGVGLAVAIGGDVVSGRNPSEFVAAVNADSKTRVIVYIGEIGGLREYEVAELIPQLKKPLVAYIAGMAAPVGKQLGHTGALIGGEAEGAAAKNMALADAGALVVRRLSEIPAAVAEVDSK